MTKKQQFYATCGFGLLFFVALCVVLFTDFVKTDNQLKRQVVFLFCSLFGGLCAGFFTGQMTVNTNWGVGKKAGITAANGFAVFVVIWITLTKNAPPEPAPKLQLQMDFSPLSLVHLFDAPIVATTNLIWSGSSNPPPEVEAEMVTFLTTTLSNLWETRASSIVYHVYFTTSDASGKLVISNATEGLMPDPLLNANFWLRQSPEKYFILIPWAKNLSIAVEYTELLLTRPGYFSEKLSSKDLSAMATNSHPSKREKIVEMDRDRLVVVVQGLKRQDSLYKQIEAALSVHGRASVFEVDRLLKLKALFLVYRKSGITVAPDDSLLKNYDSLHVDAVARFTLSSISR